jgi:hypothetical protein
MELRRRRDFALNHGPSLSSPTGTLRLAFGQSLTSESDAPRTVWQSLTLSDPLRTAWVGLEAEQPKLDTTIHRLDHVSGA